MKVSKLQQALKEVKREARKERQALVSDCYFNYIYLTITLSNAS